MTVLTFARPGYDHAVDVHLAVRTCPVCTILYAVPQQLLDRASERAESWYCPNGHSLPFIETELDRQKQRAEQAERRLASTQDTAARWRDNAERERRTAIAYKGHLTRIRNRMANGVCPVPGCKRSGFKQVMQHIASLHPDWLHDHGDVAR